MASVLKVDKLDPQSGTALEIGTSGDTVSIPSGATLDISASTLTPPATMPASSGVNLTALNATQLTSGTVPAARLSGVGKILQVVSASDTSYTSSTSTSYADTGLTASITPSATTSRILVFVTQQISVIGGAAIGYGNNCNMGLSLVRDSTDLIVTNADSGGKYTVAVCAADASTNIMIGNITSFSYTDSPSSTSELVYKTQLAIGDTDMDVCEAFDGYITLMEIGV